MSEHDDASTISANGATEKSAVPDKIRNRLFAGDVVECVLKRNYVEVLVQYY